MSSRSVLASMPPMVYRQLVRLLKTCQSHRLTLYATGWCLEGRQEPCGAAAATVHFDGAMWVHYVQHSPCRHFDLLAAMNDAAKCLKFANNVLQPGTRERLAGLAMGSLITTIPWR